MQTNYFFDNHGNAVAACEQLADDLIDFEFYAGTHKIKIHGSLEGIPESTLEWLESNCSEKTQIN